MHIREAQVADAAAIARVHVDCWRSTYQGIVPEDYLARLSYNQREEMWRDILSADTEKQAVYVAQDEGSVVGFASGGPERSGDLRSDGELYAMYVLATFQRRGTGRRLASRIAQGFLQEGMQSMVVWVLATNPARRFYERLGGKLVAVQSITIGGVELEEVAYGWDDLHGLVEMGV